MSYEYEVKECILKIENVSLDLGGRPILKNVNAEVKNILRPNLAQGQVVGLLGPSGMGKTQLFRILAGLNQADQGSVYVTEQMIPVRAGMVGVVAQNYPLFDHRTILSNLVVAGKQAGMNGPAGSQKAQDLLNRFGLGEHGDKYPVQLSGGQRQRAAIAQQFMCSEYFLLMDEPFSGLDPLAKDAMCSFIGEMARTHELKTFIVVTHDIDAAIAVCDSLWLLGRERDEKGQAIPGANIRHTIDLAARGLAWRENIREMPAFGAMVNEVRQLFATL
ncbi:MAG: ATP-binding cassette domain-containing protein [Armatimonadetes bacterium]|nr:ATP-binding cassette domain-containing protein [Armatimonadota bacterium]MBS1726314.1 ABC transporter ATP-binding protein [Armatimonadota bacterium]